MSTPLSILDLTQIEKGSSSAEAIENSVGLAWEAERLGYTRVWYAEHHNSVGLASGSPEIMIAHTAAHTSTIRVGAGGVMLPNHAPLKIAEVFRLLEAMHPGRIDLGLGRAPGTDTLTAYALRRSQEALNAENYPNLVAELLAYDQGAFPDDHPFRTIAVTPADVSLPPVWLLGSSLFSGQLAAEMGLGFSFASHINRALAINALRGYRQRFAPSSTWAEPRAMLAVGVVVGETAEHARDLFRIVGIGFSDLVAGQPYQMPTLEEAWTIEIAPLDLQRAQGFLGNWFVGTAEKVAAEVRELAEVSQADEVMITTALRNQADRLRTVRSLAEAWGEGAGGDGEVAAGYRAGTLTKPGDQAAVMLSERRRCEVEASPREAPAALLSLPTNGDSGFETCRRARSASRGDPSLGAFRPRSGRQLLRRLRSL